MNTLSNSSAEPSYLARLALDALPFSSDIDSQSFFNGEQIEQRLNLLVHLVRSSDKVGVLIADQGVGKSTLLAQVQLTSGDDLRICHIDSKSEAEKDSIVEQCLHAFGIDEGEIRRSSEHEALLKNRLQRLKKLNIRPLLLIDNVEHISPENLRVLIDLLAWQDDDEFLLHAILTSTRTLPEIDNIHGRLQRVDLPTLTKQEVELYLMRRLEAVGYKGELPFSDKELKQLYRHSQGNAASLDQLAHQQLLGIKISSPNATSRLNFSGIVPLLRWLGVIVLGATLILLLVFQDKVNSLFTDDTNEEFIEQDFSTEEDPLATVIVGDDDVIKVDPLERNGELMSSAEDSLPIVVDKQEKATFSDDESFSLETEQAERNELASLVAELPATEAKQDGIGEAIPSLSEQERVEADISILDAQEPTLDTAPLVYQQDWIKQQKSLHYTFQLMGAWEHDKVVEFIDKYKLTGDIAEFQSDRNGRVWYALIYGVYSNKNEALQASKNWPEPLNTLPSWLRRFDSVQKQIKSTD